MLNLDRPQWDSFFKEIAPNSPGLKMAVANALGLKIEDLFFTEKLNTELRSRVVALALNQRRRWKEYRLDGSWSTPAYPVFCYEYQSEWNQGIPLRVFLYEEALSETYGIKREKIRIVVVYFGTDISNQERQEKHGKTLSEFTKSVFLDIQNIDRRLFDRNNVFDQLIQLTRRDSLRVEEFLRVYELILRQTPRWQDRLKLALMCAALNKPEIYETLERKIAMDRYVAESLDAYAKRRAIEVAAVDANVSKMEGLMIALKSQPAVPKEIFPVIDGTPADQYEPLFDAIADAFQTNNWDPVINFTPTNLSPK